MPTKKPVEYSQIFSLRFDNDLMDLINQHVKNLTKYAKSTGATTTDLKSITPANVVRSLVRLGLTSENADVMANGLKRGPKTKA